jgi:hypothetical protein
MKPLAQPGTPRLVLPPHSDAAHQVSEPRLAIEAREPRIAADERQMGMPQTEGMLEPGE